MQEILFAKSIKIVRIKKILRARVPFVFTRTYINDDSLFPTACYNSADSENQPNRNKHSDINNILTQALATFIL